MSDKLHVVTDKADELKKAQSKKKLNFILNAQNQVKSTSLANVALIIRVDPHLAGVFKWNVFTEAIDATKDVKIDLSKWNMPNIHIKKGPINDHVVDDIALYCDIYPDYRVAFKSPLILQALGTVARDQAYNPVTDYLKACYKKWDKKPRITDFLPDYLGADRTPANDLIIKLVLMGVVAKAANPNTKFDWVLDLVGGQGVGKTTLLMKLAPPGTYTDQFLSFTDKDDFAAMRNALIVNDDEMTVSNRTSFEEIKKFITMKEFTYRPPYARSNETFKKKFILFRTTNEIRHLKDKSGDRRFLSIMCHREQQKLHPVTNLDQDYIDQIWGEAVHLYKTTTEPFKLSPEQNELLDESRQQFMYTTALEDSLRDVLANDLAGKSFIANATLWRALQVAQGGTSLTEKQKEKVRYYMEHMGWNVGAVGKVKRDGKWQSTRGFGR